MRSALFMLNIQPSESAPFRECVLLVRCCTRMQTATRAHPAVFAVRFASGGTLRQIPPYVPSQSVIC